MNPRIRSVSVLRDGKVIAKQTLDLERRDLQAIALYSFHSPGFDTTDPQTDLERAVTCSSGPTVECTLPVDVAN